LHMRWNQTRILSIFMKYSSIFYI